MFNNRNLFFNAKLLKQGYNIYMVALLNLSSWWRVMVERLFLAVPRGCLQFVIVVFPDHTHLLFFYYRYHKIRKAFSKFYYRHSELIVKHNIGLKTLLQEGISEPIFYGDLVINSNVLLENQILVIYSKR